MVRAYYADARPPASTGNLRTSPAARRLANTAAGRLFHHFPSFRQRQLFYLSRIITSSVISTAIMAADMQWGVTPPISLALPQESEKRANEALSAELRAQNTYEHATETQKRYSTIFLMGLILLHFFHGQE